ncbi:MAG: LacI family DNA-binding transcriptional regulator, partial [Erysipelotrichaceae bacterium]
MKARLTIKDIAELASTSKTTVSFYLNGKIDKMSEETKNRIAQVIEETDYHPSAVARSLNNKNTLLIGVIIGDITNTFANQLVKGIDDIARDKKYQLIVGNSNYEYENEAQYVKRMIAMGVDGFIVQPTVHFKMISKEIENCHKPIVYIDSQVRNTQGLWVKTNNYEAVFETCEVMINKGYEEFVMITADPTVLTTRMERTRGLIDQMKIMKHKYKTMIVSGETTSDEIEEYIDSNIDFSKKTCVFAANCWLLPKVFVALKKHRNLMPNHIGLLGFDNLEWSEFSSPTVTTIVQPAFEEGRQAANILIDSIEEIFNEAPNQILKCKINQGDSTI